MSTILLTWNPDVWSISDEMWTDWLEEVARNGISHGNWSTGRNKSIQPGDRCYLVKQGKEPRGIVASGWAVSDVYQDERTEGAGDVENAVEVDWDDVVDPEAPLPMDRLKAKVPEVNWRYLLSSGITAKPAAEEKIARLWEEHLGGASRRRHPAPKSEIPPREGPPKKARLAPGAKGKMAVAQHAQDMIFDDYRSRGWKVEDHSADHPYDGKATKNGKTLYIECKGTQGSGLKVNMSYNEVEFANSHAREYELAVVSKVKLNRNGTVKKRSGELRIVPWDPGATHIPRSFYVSLPPA